MKKIIILTLFLFLLVGCDIPGKITIVNRSKDVATYRCVFSGKDSIILLPILTGRKNNRSGIMFGFGHQWTDKTITDYVTEVDKIEILSISDTLALFDKIEMYKFFRDRRKGLFKDEIKIVIH